MFCTLSLRDHLRNTTLTQHDMQKQKASNLVFGGVVMLKKSNKVIIFCGVFLSDAFSVVKVRLTHLRV